MTTEPRDRTAKRRWWIVGAAGVSVMTALAIWFGVASATGKVNWTNTGFEVTSSQEVQVRFDLSRDPSRAVQCVLEAQDESHFVVGRTTTVVDPADSSRSRHVATVRTAGPAVSGYVDRCDYVDPG
ncbi:MAG: DUF4307 domain-containing protein [Ornithinimicrobium sp.]